ncbi:MAG: diol dehydratase small subunit [Clostridiaceae bacterium]
MDEKVLIEKIIKEVLMSMGENASTDSLSVSSKEKAKLTTADYPLASKRPELVKTPTNKSLDDITINAVLAGDITAQDVRISPGTLEHQAQIADSAGREPFAKNLRRASELISIPDDRILEIYNALRPFRSTKQELLDIADELENKYNAKINSAFVREAAEVYQQRNRLKRD